MFSNPEWLIAFVGIAALVSSVIAAGWAVFLYRLSLRAQATRWIVDLYDGFHKDGGIAIGRKLIEYSYGARLIPLLEMRVLDREVELTDQQREDLEKVDLVLNYLEQIVYLEDKKAIGRGDKEVFFEYWLGLLGSPQRSSLRRYLARCGYERLAHLVGASADEHVVFYGTLMGNSPRQRQLQVEDKLKRVGAVQILGSMYDLPTCPGLLDTGNEEHEAEIYRVLDRSALPILDEFEEFYPDNQNESRFIRRSIYIPELDLDAWVYYLSRRALPHDAPLVTDASWAVYVERVGKELPDSPPPNGWLTEFGPRED